MYKLFFTFVIVFLFTGCSFVNLDKDINKDFDFTPLSKFHVENIKKNDSNDFYRNRIEAIISNYFIDKGYIDSKEKEVDFYIRFDLNIQTKEETSYETIITRPNIYLMRGVDAYDLSNSFKITDLTPLMWSSMSIRESIQPIQTKVSTYTHEYEFTQLFIELVDSKNEKVVWQGLVKDDMKNISTSEQIEEVVNTLFNEIPAK